MRKGMNRFSCLVLSFIMVVIALPSYPVHAEQVHPDTGTKVVSEETLHTIEMIHEEIVELKMEKSYLTESDFVRLSEIDNLLEEKETQIEALGATEIDPNFLSHLINTTAESATISNDGVMTASSWHPEDLEEIYEGMYDVRCVTTIVDGKLQAHVLFQSIGNDPYLHQVKSTLVYDSFSKGSSAASYYTQETIKIYAQKVIGSALSNLSPVFSIIPWELAFTSPPPSNELSASENALSTTLNTVSVQKFVYVYDDTRDEWWFCLSTNKVSVSVTVVQALVRNGQAVNDVTNFDTFWEYGDWYDSTQHANTAFQLRIEDKRCVKKISVYSDAKGETELVINIFTPTYVAHML